MKPRMDAEPETTRRHEVHQEGRNERHGWSGEEEDSEFTTKARSAQREFCCATESGSSRFAASASSWSSSDPCPSDVGRFVNFCHPMAGFASRLGV